MDKATFISEIRQPLKIMGYRKSKNYWYKKSNDFLFCINVQSSQWSTNDYYVEIGMIAASIEIKNPPILQWYCRHRCEGKEGEKNILPEEFLNSLSETIDGITSFDDIKSLLQERNAKKVISQYWF